MKYRIVINNYQKGAKLKTTPTERIVSQTRIDSRHTEVVYDLNHKNQVEFIEKVFSRRLEAIEHEN